MEETHNPALNPEKDAKRAAMLERMAKARATRAQNKIQAPTERVTAPDTVTVENTLQATQSSGPVGQIVEKIVERVVYRDNPTPPPPNLPRQMRVERQGDLAMPMTLKFPDIRGGICEYCGVMDGNQPAHLQYKMCNHYRGMQARCSYCKENADVDEIVGHTTLLAIENPYSKGEIIFCCSLSECQDKHYKRFTRSS